MPASKYAILEALVATHSNGEMIEVVETDGKFGRSDLVVKRDEKIVYIEKHITYCGQPARHSCDALCSKAWGTNTRPKVQLDPNNIDDVMWLADSELGDAPVDPGTYEGSDAKPLEVTGPESINKWCVRECERAAFSKLDEDRRLPDFSQPLYNIASSRGKVPA